MKEKQRILVVDDDENIAELIGLYLNKECFETKLVYDGEQALKAVKDFAPNLVLLDIMPKEKHLTAFWDWNLGQMTTL